MQDRIDKLEKLNSELADHRRDYAVASEMLLLEAEKEIDRLREEIRKLKGE